jgi:hypothetical protein
MSTRARCCSLLLVAVGLGFCQSAPVTWVQLGVGGHIIARQVLPSPGQSCAQVQTPGGNLPMQVRGTATADFNVTVCEVVIPSGTTAASINGVKLALPAANAPIAIIGDTGCTGDTSGLSATAPEPDDDELKQPAASKKTDCTNPTNWGFPTIAKTLGNSTTAPGLVIHVGDYVYVSGETWPIWYSQFFQPAQPLLNSSAWLFVRGNHETCKRHGPGYFLLLDPRPYPTPGETAAGCDDDSTSPYLVPFADHQFVVLDSSGATCDFAGQPCSKSTTIPDPGKQVQEWTELIGDANKLVPPGTSGILLTHRPVWGAKAEKLQSGVKSCPAPKGRGGLALNYTLRTAWTSAAPTHLSTVISGHTHTFEYLTFQSQGVPQLIAGNGGTTRTHPLKTAQGCNLAVTETGQPYLPVAVVDAVDAWGYTILDRPSGFTLYSQTGQQLLRIPAPAQPAK